MLGVGCWLLLTSTQHLTHSTFFLLIVPASEFALYCFGISSGARVLFDYKPRGREGRGGARQSLARADVYARGATAARRLQKISIRGDRARPVEQARRVGAEVGDENLVS